MPPIIAIHLKRFAIHNGTDRRGRAELSLVKVNTAVRFSRTLDMQTFVAPEPIAAVTAVTANGHAATAEDSSTMSSELGVGLRVDGPANSTGEQAASAEDGQQVLPTGGGEGEGGGEGDERTPSLMYELYAVLLHSGSRACPP